MKSFFLPLVAASAVVLGAPAARAQPAVGAQATVSAVLNGASYSALLSPGCWAVIYGSGLAPSTLTATNVPLPTDLGGVTVTVGGVKAPLLYVSAGQINALIPFEVPAPSQLPVATSVVVTSAGTSSAAYNVPLTRNAPALFTANAQGTGPALVFDAHFRPAGTVAAGDIVILYATGLGPTDPFEIYAGDGLVGPASVLFAGLAPGFPGIYQLNIKLPALVTDRLFIRQKGWQSNIARLGIAAGQNTSNVTGSIAGIYPPGNPNVAPYNIPATSVPLSTSVLLEAAAFKVSFTILAGAQPFTVAAVGEAGATILAINPAAGTYQASTTSPTAATRVGDFSQSEFVPIIDFANCTATADCIRFPGSIVPLSRLDPGAFAAARTLSLPNLPPGTPASTGLVFTIGSAKAGSTFTLDDQSDPSVARFGGWLHLPYGPFATHTGTLELFVDGKLIASAETSYPLLHR
ncbi:MAG TPA: hypothetical protein VKJ01_24200 [Candidatus Solibacter sp.]|nr:hypothetical protein [Candidatus Solibacter sp.]